MKPYPEYKPTGLAWLPEIPKHWKLVRGKNLFKKANRPVEEGSEVITCFRDGEVTLRKNRRATGFTESLKEIGYQGIKKGDLVIHVMDAFAGAIGVSDSDGKGTPVYNVCIARTPDTTNNYYFAYIVRVMAQTGYIQSLYRGIRERSSDFRFEVFANQPLPFPPADEQAQIVRYLDAMTAKINKLIRAKKRQIALLQEQKQAIINQAVTRGLDPDVELKDSGIDWLGPIPKQWKTCRCRYLFKEKNNRSETGNEVHLSMSQRHGLIPDSKLAERCILSETYVGGKLCLEDDLVLNRLKAHLGVFSLAQQSGVVSPDYTVLQVYKSKILPQYSELVLKSQSCRRELQLRVRGIVEGFWRLYTDDFNEISLPLPSLREQQKILASILDKSEKINLIIQQGREKISLLTEYKNALIAAVVTGKVDVRNIAVEAVSAEDLTPSDDPDESEEQDSTIPEESEE